MSSTFIRTMELQDLEHIMPIERAQYACPWSQRIFEDCLMVAYEAYVLELDNIIRAYALMALQVHEAHILNICVHPDLEGRGLAARLMTHLIGRARQSLAEEIILEVRFDNERALKLYEKFGFSPIGVRKHYYPMPDGSREDAQVLSLSL